MNKSELKFKLQYMHAWLNHRFFSNELQPAIINFTTFNKRAYDDNITLGLESMDYPYFIRFNSCEIEKVGILEITFLLREMVKQLIVEKKYNDEYDKDLLFLNQCEMHGLTMNGNVIQEKYIEDIKECLELFDEYALDLYSGNGFVNL